MPIKSQYMTFYMMAIVIFALSVTINKMFTIEKCVTLSWSLEWAKVKCKCDNQKLTYDFIYDGNSSVCTISPHL